MLTIEPAFIRYLALHVIYFLIYLLSTNHKYTHTCLLLLSRESWCEVFWRWCWVLGVRSPQSIAYEVWSLRFQDKLYNSDSLIVVVILFSWYNYWFIHLWCLYMYKTWSWHTYSYVFVFKKKSGVTKYIPVIVLSDSKSVVLQTGKLKVSLIGLL